MFVICTIKFDCLNELLLINMIHNIHNTYNL